VSIGLEKYTDFRSQMASHLLLSCRFDGNAILGHVSWKDASKSQNSYPDPVSSSIFESPKKQTHPVSRTAPLRRTPSRPHPKLRALTHPSKQESRPSQRKKNAKTYNRGDSPVVTHLTTSPPVRCLNRAERTGSLVFNVLWSYVEELGKEKIYQ
jgi:hypothetical protein